ncbi:hypothetical protein LY78DRAFT_100081 [Colletotrichum sublineola]|nr:hypothetical protein LY78DRAFT_100081 [Colletotrichum sublineola]
MPNLSTKMRGHHVGHYTISEVLRYCSVSDTDWLRWNENLHTMYPHSAATLHLRPRGWSHIGFTVSVWISTSGVVNFVNRYRRLPIAVSHEERPRRPTLSPAFPLSTDLPHHVRLLK